MFILHKSWPGLVLFFLMFGQQNKDFKMSSHIWIFIMLNLIIFGNSQNRIKSFKFENGSNMIVTIVFLLLEEFVKDHGRLPKKLHLNLDNCWRFEYKKYYLFKWRWWCAIIRHFNFLRSTKLQQYQKIWKSSFSIPEPAINL